MRIKHEAVIPLWPFTVPTFDEARADPEKMESFVYEIVRAEFSAKFSVYRGKTQREYTLTLFPQSLCYAVLSFCFARAQPLPSPRTDLSPCLLI